MLRFQRLCFIPLLVLGGTQRALTAQEDLSSKLTVQIRNASLTDSVSAFGGGITGRGGASAEGKSWLRLDVSIEAAGQNPSGKPVPVWGVDDLVLVDNLSDTYRAVAVAALDDSSFCFFTDAATGCTLTTARSADGSLLGSVFAGNTPFLVTGKEAPGIAWQFKGTTTLTFSLLFEVPTERSEFQASLWKAEKVAFVVKALRTQ